MSHVNELGQPVGEPLDDWSQPTGLARVTLEGRRVRLIPMTQDHVPGLFEAFRDAPPEDWTYMGFDPFDGEASVSRLIDSMLNEPGWSPYVIEKGGVIEGFASYLREKTAEGVVEVGSIMFGPDLKRTPAGTEAIQLMIDHAFGSGYRRVEWKCDALNETSRRAAIRLGFEYEGTFRKATHYKGRNRDTAWYAMTDEDWPMVRRAFLAWLAPANFDSGGRQNQSLSQMRSAGERI